jgi:hypothetical protein
MRNFNGKNYERRYTKAIAINELRLDFIREIKGKKSAAGKLDEIIEFYKSKNNL